MLGSFSISRSAWWSLASAAAIFGGGCAVAAETPVAFTEIARSRTSGVEKATLVVVKDDRAWAELWRRHAAPLTPRPARPVVDFARDQVVGVFLGPRSNGCYAVQVRAVLQTESARVVVYHETVPGPDAICTAQMVTPAHLVRVPASSLPVEFRPE
jgi:hypothetical protein